MGDRLKRFLYRIYSRYSSQFVPRWLVLLFDVSVIFFTFYIALAIRLNFELKELELDKETPQAILVTLVYVATFVFFRSYSGIIRHTGLNDAYRIFQATAAAFFVLLAAAVVVRLDLVDVPWTTSYAALLIHFLLAYFLLMGFRVVVKSVFARVAGSRREKGKRAIIYGAGSSGMLTRNALVNDPAVRYDILAFADDNVAKSNKMLEGIPVLSPEKVMDPAYVSSNGAELLIISIQNMNLKKRAEVIEQAMDLGLEVNVVPPLDQWLHGRLSARQLRKVRIEELMERERVSLDSINIAREIGGKVVLVTGAAGSIGAEIVRQALRFQPQQLVLVDQAESALYDLQQEINSNSVLKPYAHLAAFIVASVRNSQRMEQLFLHYKPSVVYHAAAYKHVPMMEHFPSEALRTNVLGTKILADLSVRHGVKKFVMVSTDKAVNPTNVMGASKRIAEMYAQCMSNEHTHFITTRFGNVLDSNGSVIPLFRKQIERGGPLTVTHKDITRYFMMISEACNLVMEAGAMGNGGEIFVFDMGEPVKIIDLARKMIRLSGLEPDKDIMIEEVGLRPGEKLYEEVLTNEENTLPTHHPKILHARVQHYDREWVQRNIAELEELLSTGNDFDLVAMMKAMVPEFISQNSVYERLDKPGS
jgi:FlaA1/EpsC-like NDP-sugar epimerase